MKRWNFIFFEQINNERQIFVRSGMANNILLLIFLHDLIFMTKNNKRNECFFHGNHGNRMINKANLFRSEAREKAESIRFF